MAVSADGNSTTPIFDYQLQQNTLVPLLARSIALGLLHVKCKNIFQNPKGYEDTLLALCCVDKTLNGWNLERVASICRERCGGQGYLSVNKFGDYMSIAHAAVTAEGDNRVLMVKVCKDMLTNVNKKVHKLPVSSMSEADIAKLADVSDIPTLCNLFRLREVSLFN